MKIFIALLLLSHTTALASPQYLCRFTRRTADGVIDRDNTRYARLDPYSGRTTYMQAIGPLTAHAWGTPKDGTVGASICGASWCYFNMASIRPIGESFGVKLPADLAVDEFRYGVECKL